MMDDKHEPPRWLFTDLDGTLIPLDSNSQNRSDLPRLESLLDAHSIGLAFVTGRHLSSAVDAMKKHQLPSPEYIICDVGTTIAQPETDSNVTDPMWRVSESYHQHLATLTNNWDAERLIRALSMAALEDSADSDSADSADSARLQEAEKQGRFKTSFYVAADLLADVTRQSQQCLDSLEAPYSIISSVDPFTGDGLIDFLPAGVDKAYAAKWLASQLSISYPANVIFAGDSGNDTAALVSGCRSILVGNADRNVAEDVRRRMLENRCPERLFLADGPATSGVLEGMAHFVAESQPTDR